MTRIHIQGFGWLEAKNDDELLDKIAALKTQELRESAEWAYRKLLELRAESAVKNRRAPSS